MHEPTFMAYELRLSRHANPDFYAVFPLALRLGWPATEWGTSPEPKTAGEMAGEMAGRVPSELEITNFTGSNGGIP